MQARSMLTANMRIGPRMATASHNGPPQQTCRGADTLWNRGMERLSAPHLVSLSNLTWQPYRPKTVQRPTSKKKGGHKRLIWMFEPHCARHNTTAPAFFSKATLRLRLP